MTAGEEPKRRFGWRLIPVTSAGTKTLRSAQTMALKSGRTAGNLFGRKVRVPKVPYDLYGHLPAEVFHYRTWTGCVLTTMVAALFMFSTSYIVYQFATVPPDISEADVSRDPTFTVGPNTDPPIPLVGMMFRFKNNTPFYDEKMMEIKFGLRKVYDSDGDIFGEGFLDLGSIPCNPPHTPPTMTKVRCFRWANANGTGKPQYVDKREDATHPFVQGQFLNRDFAYLFGVVAFRKNEISEEFWNEIADGTVQYIVYTTRLQLGSHSDRASVWNGFPKKEDGVFIQQIAVKRKLMSIADVYYTVRRVTKENQYFDIQSFEEETSDVSISQTKVELDDLETLYTKEGLVVASRVLFRLSDFDKEIVITPFVTMFDILGMMGGFLAILHFVLGCPAKWFNAYAFKQTLKEAMQVDEQIKGFMDIKGLVKIDQNNALIRHLNWLQQCKTAQQIAGLRELPNKLNLAQDVALVATRWRRKAQGEPSVKATKSESAICTEKSGAMIAGGPEGHEELNNKESQVRTEGGSILRSRSGIARGELDI